VIQDYKKGEKFSTENSHFEKCSFFKQPLQKSIVYRGRKDAGKERTGNKLFLSCKQLREILIHFLG
jgi:hypothetical protein